MKFAILLRGQAGDALQGPHGPLLGETGAAAGHIESISASQVSEVNKGLGSQVAGFRTRPLAEKDPFLRIDALCRKVRIETLAFRLGGLLMS